MLIDGVASAATVTCAANDKVIVRSVSATQFHLSRIKYDGTAQVAASGALTLLSTVTASAAATADIETTFNSTYDAYVIIGSGVKTPGDQTSFYCRLKLGGAYDAGPNYSYHVDVSSASEATYTGTNAQGATAIRMVAASNAGNAATKSLDFALHVHNPTSTAFYKKVYWTGMYFPWNTAVPKKSYGIGMNTDTTALTGVRFYTDSSDITGTFRLYGIANS